MPQVFHPSFNAISKLSIVGVALAAGGALFLMGLLDRSDYFSGKDVVRTQEGAVPFSHKHHVNGLGIDCRYCHMSVEDSAFADIPPTRTCMNCHSQIWNDSPMLEPVRDSWKTGNPLHWFRVHDLADFVYFNHSIHINKGIGCSTCHGQVDQMPLMRKANTLYMAWCLECHRDPAKFIRPKDQVFNMDWHGIDPEMAQELVKKYNIQVEQLDNCSICHR